LFHGLSAFLLLSYLRYILDLALYEGKQGAKVEKGLGMKVVMQLAEPYLDKGKGITTDNFFTSKALADALLARNTTLVGTIRRERVEIPPKLAKKTVCRFLFTMHEICYSFAPVSFICRDGNLSHQSLRSHRPRTPWSLWCLMLQRTTRL